MKISKVVIHTVKCPACGQEVEDLQKHFEQSYVCLKYAIRMIQGFIKFLETYAKMLEQWLQSCKPSMPF